MSEDDEDRNPMGRSYSKSEVIAAAAVWPQYKEVHERDRGPLFFGTSKRYMLREIDTRIKALEKQIEKMRVVRAAIEREWEDMGH